MKKTSGKPKEKLTSKHKKRLKKSHNAEKYSALWILSAALLIFVSFLRLVVSGRKLFFFRFYSQQKMRAWWNIDQEKHKGRPYFCVESLYIFLCNWKSNEIKTQLWILLCFLLLCKRCRHFCIWTLCLISPQPLGGSIRHMVQNKFLKTEFWLKSVLQYRNISCFHIFPATALGCSGNSFSSTQVYLRPSSYRNLLYISQKKNRIICLIAAAAGNKTQGWNTIMSTSFALKFWSNKVIDIDIILSLSLTVS